MKKRNRAVFFAMIVTASLLAGCGSSKYETTDASAAAEAPAADMEAAAAGGEYLYDAGYVENENGYAQDAMPEEEIAEEDAAYEEGGAEAKAEEAAENPQAGRKLITTMTLSAETEYFDDLMGNLERQVAELGGYIENSNQWNGSVDYYGNRKSNRSASLTIRIPAEKLDGFVALMEENSNITNKSREVEDVTLAYVDLESHKKALLTEEERLLELLEMAETVEDLISIEDKLANVRYQLESMESQLRTYDNKINYSTVYLDIQEVERLTPPEDITTWGRIKNGFSENLYGLGVDIENIFVGFVINIPYILAWLVVLALVLLIVLLLAKREKKKKAERQLKRRQMPANASEAQEETQKNAQAERPLSGKLPQEAEKLPRKNTEE